MTSQEHSNLTPEERLQFLWDETNRLWRYIDRRGISADSIHPAAVAYRTAADAFKTHTEVVRRTNPDFLQKRLSEWSGQEKGSVPVCRKVSYQTRREAQKIAKQIENQHGARRTAYHCKRCDQWHLTSKTKREFKAKRNRFRERREQEGISW